MWSSIVPGKGPIDILVWPLQYFSFTFAKQYSGHILIRVELETILPILSIVLATGKLPVYGLIETLKINLYLKICIYAYIYSKDHKIIKEIYI